MVPEFPKELQKFIAREVETAGQVEVLLLLHRFPQRSWRVSEITRELRGTDAATARWVEKWRALGLLAAEQDAFRYQPVTRELRERADELAQVFRTRPRAVLACIHARPEPARKFGVRLGNEPGK